MLYIMRKTGLSRKTITERLKLYKNVHFTLLFGRNIYTANSLAPHTRLILISADWAVKLLTDDVEDAFLFTLGHEMAHKEGFPIAGGRSIKDITFARWTHEVYCDHVAAKNVDGRKAIDKILELKGRDMPDCISHPSWARRKEYLTREFDSELIDCIARDTGCTNEKSISYMKQYFKTKEE